MTKGERIANLRKLKGMSMVELADRIGVLKQTLYKYENDITTNIPSDKIELIAQVIGTTPAFIMGWEEDENVPFGEDIDKYNEQHIDVDLLPRDRTEELIIRIYRTLSPEDKETVTKLIERLAPPEQSRP